MTTVLVTVAKLPQTGWLKQQTVTSHSSGDWEVHDQSASTSGVW